MKNTKYIILLSAFCLAASCKKENDGIHRDTVTATINGKSWKAGCKESPPFGCNIADLQYYTNHGSIELGASNMEKDTGIAILLFNVFEPGNYQITNSRLCAILEKGGTCGRQGHYIDAQDPQGIEILNIDKENKIIEGRFQFIGRDTNCLSEPVHVTDGYFKLKYRP